MGKNKPSTTIAQLVEELASQGHLFDRAGQQAVLEKHPELAKSLEALFASLNEFDQNSRGSSTKDLEATIQRLDSEGAAGDSPSSMAGRSFGDYELQHVVGRGGMGVVYLARQKSLNRPVALKMIRDAALSDSTQVARFKKEALAAATLDHPNIVPVFEFGKTEGNYFFSLGYVEGDDLAATLANRTLDRNSAVRIVKEIAEALDYAHSKGIVHRDIKPANILMDEQQQPRITDFGLARNEQDLEQHTLTGQVMGTPSYMAPEQAAGQHDRVGPATDIYALGVILYEMLTGRTPFQGIAPWETINQILTSELRQPREIDSSIPPDLEAVCLKCLNKDPALRYSTAKALVQDLERLENHEPVQARPQSKLAKISHFLRQEQRLNDVGLTSIVVGSALVLLGILTISERVYLNSELKPYLNSLKSSFDFELSGLAFKRKDEQYLLAKELSDSQVDTQQKNSGAAPFKDKIDSLANERRQANLAWGYSRNPKYLSQDERKTRKRLGSHVQLIEEFLMIKQVFGTMALGGYSLLGLLFMGTGIYFYKDPEKAHWFAWIVTWIIPIVGGSAATLLLQRHGWDYVIWFLDTPFTVLGILVLVSQVSIAVVGSIAYRHNREKIQFKNLELQGLNEQLVFQKSQFSMVDFAHIILILGVAGTFAVLFLIWILNSGSVVVAGKNQLFIWCGLALFGVLTFGIELAQIRKEARRISILRDQWIIQIKFAKAMEFNSQPDIWSTSFWDALLMKLSLGLLGGTVRQNLNSPRYFVVQKDIKRLLWVPQNPGEFERAVAQISKGDMDTRAPDPLADSETKIRV